MRKLFFVSFLFFSIFILSCEKRVSNKNQNSSDFEYNSKIKIGLSIDTLIIERWRRDCEVFISKAKELDASIIVQNAANSVSEQIRQINYLIDQNVDVLVIVPKEATSLSDVIKKAKSKGIPVISYDRLIRDADIDLYISVNSQTVGKFMAESVKKYISSGGCFCIYGSPDDYNMLLVDKGVHDVFAGTKISCDFKYFTQDWNYDLAYSKMNELIANNLIPDAIICGNDAIAECVIRSLSEFLPGNKIPVVGQDADVLACRRILSGTQKSTVYKPIELLAEKSAEYACKLAQNKNLSYLESFDKIDNGFKDVPVLWLEPVSVNAENLEKVIVDSGFHTKFEVFR